MTMDIKENKEVRSKEEIEEEDKLYERICGVYNDYTDGYGYGHSGSDSYKY